VIRPHGYHSAKVNVPSAAPVNDISYTKMVMWGTQSDDSPVSVEKSVCDNHIISLDTAFTRTMSVPDGIQNFPNDTAPTAVPVSNISVTEEQLMDEMSEQLDSPVSVEKSVCDNRVIPLDEAATKQMAVPDEAQYLGPKAEDSWATYEISGTLDPDECDWYGPWYFSPGETITISISWTPPTSTVDVGILSASSGIYYYVPCTGGGCSHTFVVNAGDYYYPGIRNEGPHTVRYNGYLTI